MDHWVEISRTDVERAKLALSHQKHAKRAGEAEVALLMTSTSRKPASKGAGRLGCATHRRFAAHHLLEGVLSEDALIRYDSEGAELEVTPWGARPHFQAGR